jgi:membrane protease subunit HflK
MAHDQQTYRRATTSAIVGLVVQVVLSIAIALIGLWAKSPALGAATWYFVGGIPIWIVLCLLYNQARIERVEALEAEQLIHQDQQAAAIFEEQADDLDLARRRLQKLQTWGLNIVSLLVAIYLLGVGGYYFQVNKAMLSGGAEALAPLGPNTNPTVLLFLSAGIAFMAFAVGRYISGMTSIKEWKLLRGGASYLMGNFLMAVLTVIGAVVVLFTEKHNFMGTLAVVFPAITFLVGLEFLVTFLLGAYRPRKKGEVGRPAFDSRVLGMLTAPKSLGSIISETINYQFGFEITSSWFYKDLSKLIMPLLLLGVAVVWLSTSLVVVQPHQQALILHMGKISSQVGPGPHFKLPWPFGQTQKFDVDFIHEISVGSVKNKKEQGVPILWTNQHSEGEEDYMITAPTPNTQLQGAGISDNSTGVGLLPAEVVVQYSILTEELEKYATSADKPAKLLKNLADRHVNEYFSTHDVDFLLAHGREKGGMELQKAIAADARELGLKVTFVGITSVHPPTKSEVADKFHEVINALQQKESAIQEARGEAIRILSETAGSFEHGQKINTAIKQMETAQQERSNTTDAQKLAELDKKLQSAQQEVDRLLVQASGELSMINDEAQAYRWERSISELARASRIGAEFEAYKLAPRYYRARQSLDTLVAGIKDRRKIIVSQDQETGNRPVFRFDFKDPESALDNIITPSN